MPLTFELDRVNSLVCTTGTGVVGLSGVLKHLREKDGAEVISWAELFDATDLQIDLSIPDLHRVAKEAKQLCEVVKWGKLPW